MQSFDIESNSASKIIQLSILVVGESGVGKSSLSKIFTGENKSVTGPTVIASTWQKTTVLHDVKVNLLIWDLAGKETFRNYITSYFDEKDGVLFVYDITSQNSFQKLSYWLDLVRKYNKDFVSVIVGNKSDSSNEKSSVTSSDGAKFAKENGLKHMETSAKNGNNVENVFEYLVLELFLKKNILFLGNNSLSRKNRVDIVSEPSFHCVTSSELPSRQSQNDRAEQISNSPNTNKTNKSQRATSSSAITERTKENKEESSDDQNSDFSLYLRRKNRTGKKKKPKKTHQRVLKMAGE